MRPSDTPLVVIRTLAALPRSPRRALTHRPATSLGASLRLEALARAIERVHTEGRFPDSWRSVAFQQEVGDVLGHLVAIASHTALASSYTRESRRVTASALDQGAAHDAVAEPPDALCDALDVAYALRFIEIEHDARPA